MKKITNYLFLSLIIFFMLLTLYPLPESNSQIEYIDEYIGDGVYFFNLELTGVDGIANKRIYSEAGKSDINYGTSAFHTIANIEDLGYVWVTPTIVRYAQIVVIKSSYFIETTEAAGEIFPGTMLDSKEYNIPILSASDGQTGGSWYRYCNVYGYTVDGDGSLQTLQNYLTKQTSGTLDVKITINKNLILPKFRQTSYNSSEGYYYANDIDILPMFTFYSNKSYGAVANQQYQYTTPLSINPSTLEETASGAGGTHTFKGYYISDDSGPVTPDPQIGAITELPPEGSNMNLYNETSKNTLTSSLVTDNYFALNQTVQSCYGSINFRIRPEYKISRYTHYVHYEHTHYYGILVCEHNIFTESETVTTGIFVNNRYGIQDIYTHLIITSEYSFEPTTIPQELIEPLQPPSANITKTILEATVTGTVAGVGTQQDVLQQLSNLIWTFLLPIIVIIIAIIVLIIVIKKPFGKKKGKQKGMKKKSNVAWKIGKGIIYAAIIAIVAYFVMFFLFLTGYYFYVLIAILGILLIYSIYSLYKYYKK